MPRTFMFDTNVFDRITKGIVAGGLPEGARAAVTHIQRDELADTADAGLRARLLAVLGERAQERLLTESAVWGVSRWGEAKWGEGDLYSRMLAALNAIKKHRNNEKDILIAETALKLGHVLVTTDGALKEVMRQFGGEVADPQEVLR